MQPLFKQICQSQHVVLGQGGDHYVIKTAQHLNQI